MSKAIISIQKQNDGMYLSLVAKGIQFERVVLSEGLDEETTLKMLNEENAKLKELVKANRPPALPKEEKPKQPEPKPKAEKTEKPKEEDDEDDEETHEEPVKKFTTITNMEDMKRAFFNGDLDVFSSQLKANPLKIFNVSYKFSSDKDGAPEFSAKNLVKGFVRSFNDHKKYFMICFRCWKNTENSTYRYDSFWIVNTSDSISDIIGGSYDDFEFVELDRTIEANLDEFIKTIGRVILPDAEEQVKVGDYVLIEEAYVH